jgi:hypothetical protein
MPQALAAFIDWLDRIDPGTHRRIKGLRLVTAYGIAALLAVALATSGYLGKEMMLVSLAAGFALWASVSEGRTTRAESSRDLLALNLAAGLGAAVTAGLTPLPGSVGPELTLVVGAFLAGWLRRYGILGTGVGSQFYIGQLLAYTTGATAADLPLILAAAVMGAVGSIVPRVLSGPAEHPVPPVPAPEIEARDGISPQFAMGLQAAAAALVIIGLNAMIGLEQSAWAITAIVYVVAGSTAGTYDRVRQRIIGTIVGVPLGLACLPVALDAPILIWMAAALAMVIYAMALPERYDIACGAFAFTLIVTLAATGEHSFAVLSARLWETILGGALGVAAAILILPLRPVRAAR